MAEATDPLEALVATVLQLDAAHNLPALNTFIASGSHHPHTVRMAVSALLTQGKVRPAFFLAVVLANSGRVDPFVATAQILGGIVFNRPDEEMRGLATLQAQADALSVEAQKALHGTVFEVMQKILGPVSRQYDPQQIMRRGAISKAIYPFLRIMLDQNETVSTVSLEGMRQRAAQTRLLSYRLPPGDVPRQQRRAVVAMRERVCFGRSRARVADFGPRIVAALTAYGWQAKLCNFMAANISELPVDVGNIVEACRQHGADFLLVDLNIFNGPVALGIFESMVVQLRQNNPRFKMVACPIDIWFLSETLIATAPWLDLIWTREAPSLPIWQHPALVDKVLQAPFPTAGHVRTPDIPLIPEMLFSGSASAFFRSLWLATSEEVGLPIRKSIFSQFIDDGLPPLESLQPYMQRLYDATCVLSFTMHDYPPPSYVVTWRAFEGTLNGALMVQEATKEMHYYFVPGEHYLEFSTLAELRAIGQFLVDNRQEAEKIRHRGNAFARSRYSDDKLVGYLDQRLYFPDA